MDPKTNGNETDNGNSGNGQRTRSLRDQAYERLKRLLLLQQIPEGTRIREAEWALRLSVNRAALREAFARLEAEGFIEKGPRTGYFVPVLVNSDILEIIEVRVMLEGGAIDRIIERGLNTPQQLQPMAAACDQLERLVQEEYLLGVAEADRRYHESLITAAENRRLALLYQRAPLPIIHPQIVSGQDWAARVQRTLFEHRSVLTSIREGNAAQAKLLLREHLNERAFVPFCAH